MKKNDSGALTQTFLMKEGSRKREGGREGERTGGERGGERGKGKGGRAAGMERGKERAGGRDVVARSDRGGLLKRRGNVLGTGTLVVARLQQNSYY